MGPVHLGIYRSEELDVRVYSVGNGGGEYFLLIFPRPSLNAIHPDTLSLVTAKTEMDACSWQCNGKIEGYKTVL